MGINMKKAGKTVLRVVLRTLLVIVTFVLVIFAGLCLTLNTIFNGPSPSARDVLTMSLLESSAMKWVPAVFLGEEKVQEIQKDVIVPMTEEISDVSAVVINPASGADDEWKDYPDGIRIEEVHGENYNAYVMIIRDPSKVYVATSSDHFSTSIPGKRITDMINEEGALAAVNGGAFNDDGTTGSYIGSLPMGLTYSNGECVFNDGGSYYGFAGFTDDNILVVSKTMSKDQAEELNIRDGVCFGPPLIINGVVNDTHYASNSGYNPRTAIGQRADGVVLLVTADGRQAGSLGATYADLIDIMVEFGAVNACNLDGGASAVMLYRDTYGRYGENGEVVMVNNYSVLQDSPRKMPTFVMVRPEESEE